MHFAGKHGPYIIAEIGGNHEGDFEYAKKLTELAASSGVDAVKFQIYTGDTLVNALLSPDRNKHFKKFQLTGKQYLELAELCHKLGATFMASVWDVGALDYIDQYIKIYKIGSGDLTAYNIIRKIMGQGKPIILSSGLATLEEISACLDFIKGVDASYITEGKVAVLQCTSMYPIPDEDANLNVMRTLRQATGLPVGYSDHTVGTEALEVAVAMGAEILEMHFTDTREGKTFRDHKVSLTKKEVEGLIEKIAGIRRLQGSFEKKPTPAEIENGHVVSFRRGVYPSRALRRGAVIEEKDLVSLRPCAGIGAERFFEVIGRTLNQDVSALQELSFEMFHPDEGGKKSSSKCR